VGIITRSDILDFVLRDGAGRTAKAGVKKTSRRPPVGKKRHRGSAGGKN